MKPLNGYLISVNCREGVPNINEHLKTLDIKIVLKTLNNKFADGKKGHFKIVQETGSDNKSYILSIPKEFIKYKDSVINELDLMMWYITKEWIDGDNWKIQIESKQPENCNEYVYKTCDGLLFHVTSPGNAKYILNKGLRIKGNDNYRKFPSRNYFVVGKDSKDRKKHIKKVIESFYKKPEYVSILKIDLKTYPYNIDFYHDPMYDFPNAVYAYTMLPQISIEKVKLEDI